MEKKLKLVTSAINTNQLQDLVTWRDYTHVFVSFFLNHPDVPENVKKDAMLLYQPLVTIVEVEEIMK